MLAKFYLEKKYYDIIQIIFSVKIHYMKTVKIVDLHYLKKKFLD